jgi:hypothetical protein
MFAAQRAARRVAEDLGRRSTMLAEITSKWLSLRCDTNNPEDYFTEPQSAPILALPWWLENSIRGDVDVDFQSDLMYSTISGYYFTRMLDDIMDGHRVHRATLPALHPFHTQFVSIYFKYFSPSDPFWQDFERSLTATVEATAIEATLEDIGEAEFIQVCGRKPAAAAIPMAAVCCRYCRHDLLRPWEEFFTLFGRWHQMRDDLVDWSSDHEDGNRTWLLCEAQRRRMEHESVPAWMGREGFQWVKLVMECWMEEAATAAAGLNSPELVRYLNMRRNSFSRHMTAMLDTAAACAKLLQLDASCTQN